MTNNDYLRSIRYLMDINEAKIVEIINLNGFDTELSQIKAFLKDSEEEGYLNCSDEVMAHFLNGLVSFKRGKNETLSPPPLELPITNNVVLKKLKVAFELREEDMHEILQLGGFQISRSELSSFLRKKGHRNYRECGDQVLRNFLKGLTRRVRG